MRDLELRLQADGFKYIVGVDEAGRGPLAGPVVAAVVHIPASLVIEGVSDSKALSPKKRSAVYQELITKADYSVGQASPEEIDEINILQASLLAMKRSIAGISSSPDYCLVDGNQAIPGLEIPQRTVVKGDATCHLIAAASIIAKVTRDRLMEEYDKQYPAYGFARHKGYPTAEHLRALARYGPSPIHRRSFKRVSGEAL